MKVILRIRIEVLVYIIILQCIFRWSYLRKAIRHYPQIKDMLAQASKCAVCGESFLNTWLECVRFVDAQRVRTLEILTDYVE